MWGIDVGWMPEKANRLNADGVAFCEFAIYFKGSKSYTANDKKNFP